MVYGSVKGVQDVYSTITYLESGGPRYDIYVDERNLKIFTMGILGSDETPLRIRMQNMARKMKTDRSIYEAYHFILSYAKEEYDVEKSEEIDTMIDHVYDVCLKHFGHNVPYSIHIQADGKGGNLHAHITALNIDLNTGKSIRGYSNLYKWRHNMNEVTREWRERNKKLEYPYKEPIIISEGYGFDGEVSKC